MYSRGVVDDAFFLGVAVEPGDRRQTPADRRSRPAPFFEFPREHLDVGAAHVEELQAVAVTPGSKLAEV